MVAVVLIAGVLVIFLGAAILRGFVLTYLWQWFLVPLGLGQIGVAHAIGISLIASMFTNHLKEKSGDGGDAAEKLAHAFGLAIAAPLAAWGIGYVVHGFMA